MATQPPSLFPVRKNPLYLHDDARTQGGNKLSVSEMMWRNMRGRGNSNAINPSTGKFMTMQEASSRGPFHTAGYNTSGVGPGTRGYRGSYMHGGYNYGQGTRGPSARNSAEYYSQRDAVTGNPLDWLFMNGPGGRALMDRIVNESSGAGQPAQGGMPASYAVDDTQQFSDLFASADQPPTLPPGVTQQGGGDTILDDGTGIYDMGGGKKQIFGKYGTGSSYTNPFALPNPTVDASGKIEEKGSMPSAPRVSASPFYKHWDQRNLMTKAADRLAPWTSPISNFIGTGVNVGKMAAPAVKAMAPWNIGNTMRGFGRGLFKTAMK